MKLTRYLVSAHRELPGGLVTNVTKAIQEETESDALIEFCNILGISAATVMNHPERMGTGYWCVTVRRATRSRFLAAVKTYNLPPVRSDFRAGYCDK